MQHYHVSFKIIMLTYDWNEVASKHNDLVCWHNLSWMKGQIKATVVFLSDNNAIKRAWTQTIYRYWFIVVKLLELNVQLYPKSLHHKHSQYKINRNLDLNEIFSDSDWILLHILGHRMSFSMFSLWSQLHHHNYPRKHFFRIELLYYGTLVIQIRSTGVNSN